MLIISAGCAYSETNQKNPEKTVLIFTEESDGNECYSNTYLYEDGALKLNHSNKYIGSECGHRSMADSAYYQFLGDKFMILEYLYDPNDGYSTKPQTK